MGLDMYLYKKVKDAEKQDVAYWRKANQIRGWFVRHGLIEEDDDCVERPITRDDLVNLVADCEKVLADKSLAQEVLPCTQGFFFGSDEYDEYYFTDLIDTVDQLSTVLETSTDEDEFIYSDWW